VLKMSKKLFYIVIIIASVSLCGTVFTQLFWVKNAVSLKQEQFDHRVSVALKSVVNRLLFNMNDKTSVRNLNCQKKCSLVYDEEIIGKIDPNELDSLLKEELKDLEIPNNYEYGVIYLPEKKLIITNCIKYHKELLNTPHQISLTCIMTDNCYVLGIYFPYETNYLYRKMLFWLFLSGGFTIIIILSFSFTVYSYIRQKKLTAMKSDFVNNMTHELKTPISTISLSSEMLLQKEIYTSPEKIIKYARVIYDENFRLKNQVDQVLQAAIIDKKKLELKKQEVNIHKLIEDNIEKIGMIIKNRDGTIVFNPTAQNYLVYADRILISTVISNLLENACKYSNDKPEINIKTSNTDNKIVISIEDKGIGIPKENQKDIFKEFYRVGKGNIHDIKGFGLGLYFVKTIVEAHGGKVKVKSEINKGSLFEIIIPIHQE
jgi:two-component system phosphate regulon sensor histidine kinase PhoR